MDGPWQPGAWGGGGVSTPGQVCMAAFVCVCVSVRVFVYLGVFVTLTPFCPRWPREGRLMEGKKRDIRTHAL